jgi:membrane protease YdiL (CAAX protease family)
LTDPRPGASPPPDPQADPTPDPVSRPGPPGERVFSLEGRPAPGLYLVGWLLALGGAVLVFTAMVTQAEGWRIVLGLGGTLVLGLGLAAAAGYQVVARTSRPPGRYRGPSPLLLFGVVLCLSTVTSGLPIGLGLLEPRSPTGFLGGLLLVAASYVVGVWLFVVRTGALTWTEMGWPTQRAGRLGRALRDAAAAAAVMVPVTGLALVWGGILALLLGVEAPAVVPLPDTSTEALAVVLAMVVVAPVGEEVFFRGFALRAWLADLPTGTAVMRSALFFAVIHIVNITADDFATGASQALLQFLVILPLGVVLGLLFVRRGLVAAIVAHVTYNGLLLALLLAVPRPPISP